MTAKKLRARAVEQILLSGEYACVAIRIPGRWRKSNKRRICPGGPLGTIVSEEPGGLLVVLIEARKLIAWLDTKPKETPK